MADGRVVVVTGGAGGIGRAVARRLAAEGDRVVVMDLPGAKLDEAVEELEGDGVAGIPVDVTDEDNVREAFARLARDAARVGAFCNVVGVADGLLNVDEIDVETWDRIFAANVRGAFLMARAALEQMDRGASIVNVVSVAGFVAGVAGAAYTASKHALLGLTRNMAHSLEPRGIRCNAVCPGGIDSGMQINTAGTSVTTARVDALRRTMPRRGRPEEVANVVRFLLDDEASFVTGAVLAVDGGWSTTIA